MHALVDCNNFFVSCERVFRPDLRDKPVAVLSSNDGCIVSRSNEVKKLGVPMASAYFKHKTILDKHNVVLFSSNFSLYGDMSDRVMSVLHGLNDKVEEYSVDEAFLPVDGYGDPETYACTVRDAVVRHTGISTAVGVGSTKTLAKVASEITKRHPEYEGVLVIDTDKKVEKYLKLLPVGELWGVGRGYGNRLHQMGIYTAYELAQKPDAWVRKHFGIGGLHVLWELRGQACPSMSRDSESIPKSIIRSRSFGKKVTDKASLREALATHASNAGRKLRAKGLTAGFFQIYITTSRFRREHYYANRAGQAIAPTDDSFTLTKIATQLLEKIYKPNYRYSKVGVTCLDIAKKSMRNATLFDEAEDRTPVLAAVDALNERYGKHTVFLGALGIERPWKVKNELSSPAYTSKWSDLPVVKAM